METREQKFKQHREDIAMENNQPEEVKEVVTQEDINNLEDNHAKKNTLTMSIDQIIEAHDEYTVIIEQRELEDKIKKERKEKKMAKTKVILKWVGIGVALALIVAVLVIVILKIIGA